MLTEYLEFCLMLTIDSRHLECLSQMLKATIGCNFPSATGIRSVAGNDSLPELHFSFPNHFYTHRGGDGTRRILDQYTSLYQT